MNGFARVSEAIGVVVILAAVGGPVYSRGPNTQKAVVSQTGYFGPITPGKAGTPAAVVLPFQIPIADVVAAKGYKVTAISNFVFVPAAAEAGGRSITAADIGVGISNVTGSGGAATVVSGFDYDPGAVRGNGHGSPYAGAGAGRGTLADLQGGREVLQVGKSAVAKDSTGAQDLFLTVKVAVPSRYFTPGSYSGSVTLVVQ